MIKGLWKVPRRLADGSRRWYVYAWRNGGPLLGTVDGETFPKTLPNDIIAAYADAATRRVPKDSFEELVVDYLGSPEWTGLEASTRFQWLRHVEKLRAKFGSGPLAAFEDRRMKRHVLAYRDAIAHAPRTADMAMQVLRRILSWGVARGRLAINIAEGIPALYRVDRAHIVIEPHELARFRAARPKAHGDALALACATGLRRGDLCALTWNEVDDLAIRRRTLKSKRRREAVIPLTDEARAVLAALPRVSTTVLTHTQGRPWRPASLTQAVRRGFEALGIDKHLHDARGTFATMLARAGFSDSEIAEAMGWAESDVRTIRRKYVDRAAIVISAVERLRNAPGKTPVKREGGDDGGAA